MRKHGHVGELHRILAEHDLEFLRASEAVLDSAYRQPRRLPRLTKELVFVAVIAASGASQEMLRAHMVAAAAEGATSGDVLELLELVVPTAGVPRFMDALEVWRDVFGF